MPLHRCTGYRIPSVTCGAPERRKLEERGNVDVFILQLIDHAVDPNSYADSTAASVQTQQIWSELLQLM